MIRLKTFRYSLGILIFAVGLGCFWQRANAQIVEIPDTNLERAIREELGLSSEVPITQQEMLRLSGLRSQEGRIENLTGLEYAHNIENLGIAHNPIEDLSPIFNLTRLRTLALSEIPIEDPTFLKNLTELEKLYVGACGITDLTVLQYLTKLVFLNLSYNRIVDISPLANLTQLETLLLHANLIVNVSPLANLTSLKTLWIDRNQIVDFSPLDGLSLTELRYDEVCDDVLPNPSIQDRIDNRNLPSVALAWSNGISNSPSNPARSWWDDLIPFPGWTDPMPYLDRIAYHDLWFSSRAFGLDFQLTPQGYQRAGDMPSALAQREALLTANPNMLFLIVIRNCYAKTYNYYPEDWFGWLKDENGNLMPISPGSSEYYFDFRLPAVQDIIVQQAIAVAKCGLYDGIMFDSWSEDGYCLPNSNQQLELPVLISMLRRIREGVRDDFLILCNQNRRKLPFSAPYINGGFMETFPRVREQGYSRDDIIEIEANLIWYETNMREPKINVLRGFGIGAEPPDSPNNRRWMRLFTTMSLTLSDGYSLYTLGTIEGQKQYQKHIPHAFWDADLGQPVGATAHRYQEDIEGLYIREFTNGWAVYNRSGQAQTITLPTSATPVSDRGSTAASITHLLPDLDGEIYLKTKHPADVNGDWVVNVLDLIQVSNNLGKSAPDLNGDGVVNILDLVFVSKYLASNED